MIEMLGVLAIIGVLSVGGIAGYSKAMMKVKINKTIDEVSQAAANIQTLYKSQTDYSGLECCDTSSSNSCDLTLCRKAKIVPEEFFVGDSKLVNPFDGSLAIYSAANNAQDIGQEAFTINIDGIPQDACIELATLDWGATNSGLIAIGLSIDSYVGPASYEGCPGSQDKATACVGGSSVSVPMPISLAAENCYEDSSRNRIIITFH
jgi:type II secretory pathway pseudopilin PulG